MKGGARKVNVFPVIFYAAPREATLPFLPRRILTGSLTIRGHTARLNGWSTDSIQGDSLIIIGTSLNSLERNLTNANGP
jgi:hypothetical protein